MSHPQQLPDYLDHMLEAARLACSYVEGIKKTDFMADRRTQQAVILNLIILGEAATKLLAQHERFCARHAEVPWRNMKGMRNRIAHGYFDVNLDLVWDTVQTAMPRLVEQLPAVHAAALVAGGDEHPAA